MDSSSGFGSTPGDMRAIHTRFRCGSGCHCLNRPPRVTRRIILQKARRQPGLRPRPSTARKQTVSGSISLPSPGCFSPFPHGTVRYRSLRVCSLGKWAPQLHTRLLVSGATQAPILRQHPCLLPGCHGLWRRFPDVFGYASVPQCSPAGEPDWASNPASATPAGLTHPRFRLLPVRSPLLREYFLFLGVHEMFQFPRCPPCEIARSSCHHDGVAPFGDRGINACSRLPHAYRSYATSFIGTQRRGIHPLLLVSSQQEDVVWISSIACFGMAGRTDHAPFKTLCTW